MQEFIPSEFFLSQNFPNPFRNRTKIKYCVPLKTRVLIAVFNADGDLVEILVNEIKNPGAYEVEFSACHSFESSNQKEDYFCRLEASDYQSEKKMELIK